MSPARIAKLSPKSLDDGQRAVYDAITSGPRASGPQLFPLVDEQGRLEGPFNAFLLQPGLGGALQAVGSAIRYGTSLTDRAREIAILVVSVHWDSAFERFAHEAVGRHFGITEDELDALRRRQYDTFPDEERVVATTTDLLTSAGDLDDAAYDRAVRALGERGVFELLTLVGYYAALALQLRVFRVGAPEA